MFGIYSVYNIMILLTSPGEWLKVDFEKVCGLAYN